MIRATTRRRQTSQRAVLAPQGDAIRRTRLGLMAGDHGGTDGPTGSLAEEAREDVEKQPADVGEEVPVVTAVQWPAPGEEDAQDLGNGTDELSVGQAQ
jgi:hypothetical protein